MELKTDESDTSARFKNQDPKERLCNYFHYAAKTTVKKYLSTFSFRVFKKLYPELVGFNRKQCKAYHAQLISQLGTSITEDLNYLFRQEKVFRSLRRLDEAIVKQEGWTEGWIPSGNPEEDLRDHLYEVKLKQKEKLLKIYQDMKAENEALNQELSENDKAIQEARREIMNINSEMNVHFKELKDMCKNPLEPECINGNE